MNTDHPTATASCKPPVLALAEVVHALIGEARFRYHSEAQLQEQVADVLKTGGLSFEKEFRLTEKDRPDFFFNEAGLAVEVKITGSLAVILRQLKRYADHPSVRGVLLVSQRPHSLPATLSDKPIYLCSIWRNGIC